MSRSMSRGRWRRTRISHKLIRFSPLSSPWGPMLFTMSSRRLRLVSDPASPFRLRGVRFLQLTLPTCSPSSSSQCRSRLLVPVLSPSVFSVVRSALCPQVELRALLAVARLAAASQHLLAARAGPLALAEPLAAAAALAPSTWAPRRSTTSTLRASSRWLFLARRLVSLPRPARRGRPTTPTSQIW